MQRRHPGIGLLITVISSAVLGGCGAPAFTSQGVDFEGAELQHYAGNAGVYEVVEELADLSALEELEPRCAPEASAGPGGTTTLQFEGNTLTVTGEAESWEYVYQETGTFCRELRNGNIECMNVLDKEIHYLEVYESAHNFRKCFSGSIGVRPIAPAPEAEGEGAGVDISEPEGEEASDPPEDDSQAVDEPAQPGAPACDATQHLFAEGEITMQETNEFGSRLCNYTLSIINNGDEVVWFYVYVHEEDGYQHTSSDQWMGNFPLNPGLQWDWPATVNFSTDEDVDGPTMNIPARLAGVYGSPECAEARQDHTFLEEISVPVNPACPIN